LVPEHSDEALASVIRYGVGEMAGQDQLSAQEIADVVAYSRELFP
jgi:mono/diheme cytochrome c family protein